jgi:hypothetical protein
LTGFQELLIELWNWVVSPLKSGWFEPPTRTLSNQSLAALVETVATLRVLAARLSSSSGTNTISWTKDQLSTTVEVSHTLGGGRRTRGTPFSCLILRSVVREGHIYIGEAKIKLQHLPVAVQRVQTRFGRPTCVASDSSLGGVPSWTQEHPLVRPPYPDKSSISRQTQAPGLLTTRATRTS